MKRRATALLAIAALTGVATAAPAPRSDDPFGLIPTGVRPGDTSPRHADQQTCDVLAGRITLAVSIGNRAGEQDARRQRREAGCP